MKENWTKKIRHKLEGHQMPPPEGLWESINEKMPHSNVATHQPTTLRRWIGVAAAVVLALAGYFFLLDDSRQHPQRANELAKAPSNQRVETESPEETAPLTDLLTTTQSQTKTTVRRAEKNTKHSDANSVTTISDPVNQVSPTNIPSTSPHIDKPSDEKKSDGEEHTSDVQVKQSENKHRQDATTDISTRRHHPKSEHRKWSLGMNASGGLLAVQNSHSIEPLYYSSNDFYQFSHSGPARKTQAFIQREYVTEHDLPIRLGMNLNYQLTPHLSLSSGISYTYLHSKLSIPLYRATVIDQKLHYLGIPLGAIYSLWTPQRFHLYVSGTVLVEKCLNENPWQLSAHASVGAEYGITRHIGVYAEPALGYYFDDNSSLDHYYKKHPLAPSIELGLRVHLNR